MSSISSKKAQLLSFIEYKEKHLPKEEWQKLYKYLKKLSYANLKAWAIRNDIID